MRMFAKGESFMRVEADGESVPLFSESYLYDVLGKGDARFVLGVAEEYEHLIKLLGPVITRQLLTARVSKGGRERLRTAITTVIRDEAIITYEG